MLVNVSARLGAGLQFQAGVNTGKTVQDNCAVRAQVPELTTGAGVSPAVNVGNPYCHSDPGLHHQGHRARRYTVPKIDVLVSGTFRSDQGAPLAANWRAPVALVSAGSAGRPPSLARRCRSTWWRPVRCGAIASTRSTCASPRSCGSAACGTPSASTSST